jgi:hypothetical protein
LDIGAHRIHDVRNKGDRDEHDHDQSDDEVVVFHALSHRKECAEELKVRNKTTKGRTNLANPVK